MSEQTVKNKMGSKPVKKLLLGMGIPMIISMALQALYNIVDTAFVSNMAENAQAAVNALTLAFPVQMLMVAVAIGTGVGANAVLSRALGARDGEKVNAVAGNAVFLGGVIFIVCLLFGIFGVPLYVNMQNNADAVVNEMTVTYLRICCILSFGIVFFSVYEKLLQATGKTHLSTIAQITGAVINIVLDPLLIYDYGAGLGIAGAAWATVIGQIASCIMVAVFHFVFNREVRNSIKYLRPNGRLILEIYSIGLPAIIAQALMSFMTMGMNAILIKLDNKYYLVTDGAGNAAYTASYVSAYGVYYKIQQFVLFMAFGLRDAITPLVSYNYGMRDKRRVTQSIKFGLIYTVVLMAAGLVILEAAAYPLTMLFGEGLGDIGLCIRANRIISASLVCAGVCIALQGVFQALGSGIASLIVSVCRQLLFILPPAYGFTLLALENQSADWLIWFTFVIGETVSAIIAAGMAAVIYRRKIAVLGDEKSD